jgi:hypothetical protein
MIFESERDFDGVIVDFRWVYVNPAAEKIVGRAGEDLLGKRLLEEVPGNAAVGLFGEYVKVVESGEVFQSELRLRTRRANHFLRVTAVKVGDGFAVGFSDVTERRKAEIGLRAARARLESTLAAAEVGTWTWDCVNDVVTPTKIWRRCFPSPKTKRAAARLKITCARFTRKTAAVRRLLSLRRLKKPTNTKPSIVWSRRTEKSAGSSRAAKSSATRYGKSRQFARRRRGHHRTQADRSRAARIRRAFPANRQFDAANRLEHDARRLSRLFQRALV